MGNGSLPLAASRPGRDPTCTSLTTAYKDRERMRALALQAEERRCAEGSGGRRYGSSARGSGYGGYGGGGSALARLPAGMRNLGNTCYLNAVLQVRDTGVWLRREACERPTLPAPARLPPPAPSSPQPSLPCHQCTAGAAEPALLQRRPAARAAGAGGRRRRATGPRRRLLCAARLRGGSGQPGLVGAGPGAWGGLLSGVCVTAAPLPSGCRLPARAAPSCTQPPTHIHPTPLLAGTGATSRPPA